MRIALPEQSARHGIQALVPYRPGSPSPEAEGDVLHLDSNENPWGTSPKAAVAIHKQLGHLQLYPDAAAGELRTALARRHGVEPSSVIIGNGSSDVIEAVARVFLQPGDEAIVSRFAFLGFEAQCRIQECHIKVAAAHPPSHAMAYGHDPEAMVAALTSRTRVLFIANPNNPTGTWWTEDELRFVLESTPPHVVVVVDEAYFEYGRVRGLPDATHWLESMPNLLVLRTFSKAYGLAALRVGYGLGDPKLIELLERVREPFSVNQLAQAAAVAALEDEQFVRDSVEETEMAMQRLRAGLEEFGFENQLSAGNFLFVDLGSPATSFVRALGDRGIRVRGLANYGLDHHVRITIGSQSQVHRLLRVLDDLVEDFSS